MINQRNRTPLNTRDSRVQVLSRKYNLTPKTIAYIRSAIGSKRYTVETLISHIQNENIMRMNRIQGIKDFTIVPFGTSEDAIKSLEFASKFRSGIVEVLNKLTSEELSDILS